MFCTAFARTTMDFPTKTLQNTFLARTMTNIPSLVLQRHIFRISRAQRRLLDPTETRTHHRRRPRPFGRKLLDSAASARWSTPGMDRRTSFAPRGRLHPTGRSGSRRRLKDAAPIRGVGLPGVPAGKNTRSPGTENSPGHPGVNSPGPPPGCTRREGWGVNDDTRYTIYCIP